MSAHPSTDPRLLDDTTDRVESTLRSDRGAAPSSLPENWPVDVTPHSWLMTAIVFLGLLVAGAFVFSLCRSERTAQAATQRGR